MIHGRCNVTLLDLFLTKGVLYPGHGIPIWCQMFSRSVRMVAQLLRASMRRTSRMSHDAAWKLMRYAKIIATNPSNARPGASGLVRHSKQIGLRFQWKIFDSYEPKILSK